MPNESTNTKTMQNGFKSQPKQKEEIVILLGAGASVPHIPGVQGLTEHLICQATPLANTFFPDACNSDGLFKHLFNLLNKGKKSPEYNFEKIMSAVETLQAAHVAGRISLDALLFKTSSTATDLWLAQQEGCYAILNKVREASVKTKSSGTKPTIAKAMETLAEKYLLRVFSLNYDDLPLLSNIKFFDGYVDRGHLYDNFCPTTLFDPSLPGYHCDWYIPLHGSIRFGPDIRYRGIVPRYFSVEEASEHWKTADIGGKLLDGVGHFPLPMITGYRKPDRALDEPFLTYLHVLYQTLHRANKVVIVGYGGNDVHINAQLKSVLKHRAFSHPESYYESKIIVVDWKEISPVYSGVFWKDYDDWSDYVKRTILQWGLDYWNKQVEDPFIGDGNIRRRGFSMITNRIWISTDGTEWALGDGIGELLRVLESVDEKQAMWREI